MNNDYVSPNQLVKTFHETYGMAIRETPELNVPEREMRMKLIREEFQELLDAQEADDFVEIVDAWADMIYVIYGAAITHGVNLDHVLAEVQRSNLSKLGADGLPIYREDGKVLKGPNFFAPDIAKALAEQGYTSETTEESHGNKS